MALSPTERGRLRRPRLAALYQWVGNTPWEPTEDDLALTLRANGKTYGQIAIRSRRSPDAVAARLRLLKQREGR